MKNWDKIYNLWQEQNVPEIKIRKFDLTKHNYYYPWFYIKSKYQPFIESNPLIDTAYHVSNYLLGSDSELVAAYKIYAFVRHYCLYDFLTEELNFAMNKQGKNLYGWWNGNAKNLLPSTERPISLIIFNQSQSKYNWKEVILEAARYWNQIAVEWEIIIIPDFMDRNSEEYENLKNFVKKQSEQREYQQYLSLEAKFENE
jgi:hypothetical protein